MKKTIRRLVGFSILFAVLAISLTVFLKLVIIASYRFEVFEYAKLGCSTLANEAYIERLTLGHAGGLTGFLYNLPFILKLALLLISGFFAFCSSYIIYDVSKCLLTKRR